VSRAARTRRACQHTAAVAHAEQLQWERRFALPAAGIAFLSAALLAASIALQTPFRRDLPSRDDPERHLKTVLALDHHGSALLSSIVVQGLGALALGGILFYLYRAVRHRRPSAPAALIPLFVIGPLLMIGGGALSQSKLNRDAHDFVRQNAGRIPPQAAVSAAAAREKALSRRPKSAAYKAAKRRHDALARARSQGDDRADDLLKKGNAAGAISSEAGTVALALSLVMVSLNGMRVGLTSRFLGILGMIVGLLLILPLLPVPILQIFWAVALGLIFLDRWPGGRGPAWASGEAIPWPGAADRAQARQGGGPQGGTREPQPEPEPEPGQPRPASRKRKRRKRR
jgi:hypothetical protein